MNQDKNCLDEGHDLISTGNPSLVMNGIAPPTPETQRRDRPRRIADRVIDDQHKMLSTCLAHMVDAVLLLDNDRLVKYASAQLDQFMNRSDMPFALMPKFALHDLANASRFAAFVNEKDTKAGPLCLLLGGKNVHDTLLLTCFRLPESSMPGLHTARHMITLRDPNRYSVEEWQLFAKQFTLTQAEARLCHTLANGLTVKDYCGKWRVMVSTARSQLSSVLAKTSTRRQSELLRLIYLFTRG